MYNDSLIETLVKLNSQTAGRDRVIRLFQYGSRLTWWICQSIKLDRQLIVKIQDLEYSLSLGRKLFRLGRSIDTLYAALKTIHLPEIPVRLSLTLSKINLALYLLTDHIVWIGRVGIMPVDKVKWTKHSNRFWLLSIVFALMRDLYELWSAFQTNVRIEGRKSRTTEVARSTLAKSVEPIWKYAKNNKDVVVDTVKNGCDIWLPMSALGYVKMTPGFVGFLGVISSIAGILSLIDPTLKLQPS